MVQQTSLERRVRRMITIVALGMFVISTATLSYLLANASLIHKLRVTDTELEAARWCIFELSVAAVLSTLVLVWSFQNYLAARKRSRRIGD